MDKKKTQINIAVIMLCFVLMGSLTAQDLRKEGRYWVGEIKKTFTVQPGGTLIMDEVRGDVTITCWDKNEVSIHEIKRMDIFSKGEAEAAMEETKGGYTKHGNTITVAGPAFDRSWIQSKFAIQVPEESNCEIETQGGDISITGVKANVDAASGGGDITLNSIGGQAVAKTGGGDIRVIKTSQPVSAKTGGGDVTVEQTQGSVKVSTGGGDIRIRDTQDFVRVSAGGGDVEIERTKGDVEVSVGGGEIEIDNAEGNVIVRTGGGEIDIRNVNGDFKATTGGGSINARNVKGSLEIKTGGGEIELTEIQGGMDVTTGGGDVSAEITLEDFSVDHHVNITTGGGDIKLTLPEKLPATIDAEIKYRQRSWEDYTITSDFSLKISTEEDSHYRIIRATGEINGGGDLIRLKTGGGDITIKKGK
jgi:DUF4097 and DUF4098 domain-containing protein YvlB